MQQMPIEEVLTEFRKKYAVSDNSLEPSPEIENTKNEKPQSRREITVISHKRYYSFKKLIAVQGITAVIIIGLIIAAKFLNPDLYRYITEFIAQKVLL